MADEGNQNGVGEMDLSLNLGLPQSYLNGVIDLGSALTINSSSTAEENSDPMKPPEPEELHTPANLLINVGSVTVADEELAVDPFVPVQAVPLRSFVIRDVLLVPDDAVPLIAVQPSAPLIDSPPLTTPQCHHEDSQTVRLFFVTDPNFRFERSTTTETNNQPVRQGSEEAPVVKDDDNADFECNVCFDTAKEPVVTSCGHLFCWSCLYQWLHRNLDNKECPTCKGELLGCNITPIYGRGSSGRGNRSEVEEEGKEGFVMAPRPRGSRFEGFNQWFEPIFDVADEDTMASWRGVVEEGMRTLFERVVEPSMKEMFNTCYKRLMETQAEQGDDVFGESIGELLRQRRCPRGPQGNGVVSAPAYKREDFLWQWFTLYGLAKTQRLTALANVQAMFDKITDDMSGGNTLVGASAFAGEHHTSSTMAVIQGDSALGSTSPELNSSESSGSLRRTWSSISGSSDGDDGDAHENIRRRLN